MKTVSTNITDSAIELVIGYDEVPFQNGKAVPEILRKRITIRLTHPPKVENNNFYLMQRWAIDTALNLLRDESERLRNAAFNI